MDLLFAHGVALALEVAPATSSPPTEPAPATSTADDAPPPPPPPTPPPPLLPHGLQLGAGLGYSLPIGALGAASEGLGTHVSNLETAAIPISLEAGYLFDGSIYVGGSFSWGPGVAPNGPGPCQSAVVSCFAQDIQVLAVARLYFAPRARTSGWLGLAAGWEVATFANSVGGATTTATYTGPVMVDVRLGLEVRSRPVAIAPYFGVAFGEYVSRGIDPAPFPVSTWIGTSVHEWVTFGIRGTYGL